MAIILPLDMTNHLALIKRATSRISPASHGGRVLAASQPAVNSVEPWHNPGCGNDRCPAQYFASPKTAARWGRPRRWRTMHQGPRTQLYDCHVDEVSLK